MDTTAEALNTTYATLYRALYGEPEAGEVVVISYAEILAAVVVRLEIAKGLIGD